MADRRVRLGSMPSESRLAPAGARLAARRMGMASMLVAVLSGCDTPAGAGQPNGGHELINDVAARLAGADATSYTATYALGNGSSATVAHDGARTRTAYAYPTGMILVDGTRTTRCDRTARPLTCTVTTGAGVPAEIDRQLEIGGLIRPETVIDMLTVASLDANAIVSESNTTIVGGAATCIRVSGSSAVGTFTTCVTDAGLLGSFDGEATGGHVHVELDIVAGTVANSAFDTPAGARVVQANN
jgi:hypothetical protein